jgi:hypothetical protein
MTDTLLDYDPNDTGDIPVGETRIRIETGEKTQNLGRYAIHASVVGAIPRKVIDIDDTVTFHIPPTIGVVPDLADAQPVAPWERVADTQRLTILAALGDFTGPQIPPTPDPVPPPPPPTPARGYVGRHRDPWDRVAILGDGAWERMVEAAKPAGEPRRLRVQVGVGAFLILLAAVTVTVLRVFL